MVAVRSIVMTSVANDLQRSAVLARNADRSRTQIERAVRFAIRSGARGGLLGLPGRLIGRTVGVRLNVGPRVLIDNASEFIQSEILACGAYEPTIARLIARLVQPGTVFFDVGANIGQHSMVAAYYGARVFAFEPVAQLAQRIKDNARLNGLQHYISVHRYAAADVTRRATLYIASRRDDGSHSLISGVQRSSH